MKLPIMTIATKKSIDKVFVARVVLYIIVFQSYIERKQMNHFTELTYISNNHYKHSCESMNEIIEVVSRALATYFGN